MRKTSFEHIQKVLTRLYISAVVLLAVPGLSLPFLSGVFIVHDVYSHSTSILGRMSNTELQSLAKLNSGVKWEKLLPNERADILRQLQTGKKTGISVQEALKLQDQEINDPIADEFIRYN